MSYIDDRTVYSVWVRKGPDRIHYDLIFEDEGLRLLYLGEYWDQLRPYPGLQRRSDMLLYSIRKRRRREIRYNEKFDMYIRYCDIRNFRIVRPQDFAKLKFIRRSQQTGEPPAKGILELTLIDGRRLSIEFSAKVYELVKRLVKTYLAPAVEKCHAGSEEGPID